MRYHDRREAGRDLAQRLHERRSRDDLPVPLVLALPRGGVPVADEIARALGAPLDVLVARKIGMPGREEYALGAVAGGGPPVYDPQALAAAGYTPADLAPEAERAVREVRRREDTYRQGRPAPDVAGRWVLVVDDGLATGSTARAAVRALRERRPAHVTLAVPVGSPEGVARLRADADDVECPHRPPGFGAVGFYYDDFAQLTDADVIAVLNAAATGPGPT
ncbi:phosphoribosyltransferase [Streptomyces boninensis]|uniref:phosphoribosyltransferase n=1 Tax=Streptomyces boninensis TaxID=2039455 RepID=UPI003B21DF6A